MIEIVGYFVSRQIGNIIDVSNFTDKIITRKTDKKEVEDYKQFDPEYEAVMNERKDTVAYRLVLLNLKNVLSLECRSDYKITPGNFPKKNACKTPNGYFEDYDKKSDDDKGTLREYYKNNNLYYKQELKLTFDPTNERDKQELLSKVYSQKNMEGKNKFRNDTSIFDPKEPWPFSDDKSFSEITQISSIIQTMFFPKYIARYPVYDSLLKETIVKIDFAPNPFSSITPINIKHLPYFYTYRKQYFYNEAYETNTIASQGCLIACYADILTFYEEKEITPLDVDKKMDDMDKAYYAGTAPVPGYDQGTGNMMMDVVAKEFGFKYETLLDEEGDREERKKEKKDDDVDYSQEFLNIIMDRVEKDEKPTIARLNKNGSTHFVVIVGLRYGLINGMKAPVAYIINDPGRNNIKKNGILERFIIDCQSRIYDHNDKKKMDVIHSIEPSPNKKNNFKEG